MSGQKDCLMEILYKILDFMMPFEFMDHTFMKNAFIAVVLVTPLFGLIGTMIVNNKMAFFSDSIGHSALTGIAIGVLLGLGTPIVSMLCFAVVFALTISYLRNRSNSSPDTLIGVFSSTAVALGIVVLSKNGGFSKYSSYLIGDLLSVNANEILYILIVFLLVIVLWLIFFNDFLMVSINRNLALSKGIKVSFYEFGFTIVVAVIVTVSIQWVGIMVISSLIILPSAASRNISKNIRQYHFFSVIISLVSGVIGLVLSYFIGTATGATITLIASLLFFITFFLKSKF